MKKITLDQGWEFKQITDLNDCTASSFLPVTQFPTVAHMDLLGHNLIADPFIDDNEIKSLWVNEAYWIYRTLEIPNIDLSNSTEKAVLVFEGLDTVVDVFLNGKHILFSKNMHISHRVDVTQLLKLADGKSTLELRFKNAPAFARKEKDRIGYKCKNPNDIHFGGPERLFLRKAQYHWVGKSSSNRTAVANTIVGLGLGPICQHCWSMEANIFGNLQPKNSRSHH